MTLARPSALLFDLDGTLVDSHASIVGAIRAMTAEHGLPSPTDEEFEAAVSLPLRTMLGLVTKTTEPALLDDYAASYMRHYVETMVELSNPFDGILELLDALHSRGVAMAVVTNKTEANAKMICEGRLGRRLPLVLGSIPSRPNKPDKTIALEAAQALGVDASSCWFIGDSHVDIDTAHAAKMVSVGVRWGISGALAARISHAQILLDSPAQLLEAFDAAR